MADPQPVKLRDLVESLASTMVATTQFLDQANVDLQNVYLLSSDGALAGLSPPRFTLDEVTIDLTFVVQDASVVDMDDEPPTLTDHIELTVLQRDDLEARLERSQQRDLAAIEAFERAVEQHRLALNRWQREMGEASARALDARRRLQAHEANRPPPSPFSSSNLSDWMRRRQDLQNQLQAAEARRDQLARSQPTPPSPPAVRDRNLVFYVAAWNELERTYAEAKAAHVTALQALDSGQQLPKFGRFEMQPAVRVGLDRTSLTAALEQKVARIIEDFETTVAAVGETVRMVAARQGAGIRVRVDPGAIAEAGPEALQHATLTFRSEGKQQVQVDGSDVEV